MSKESEENDLMSEKQIKKVKETLNEFDNYFSDHATDENENIIDEEAYEYADIFNDTWYYIEQLENKVRKLEKQLSDSTPNEVIREMIENEKINMSGFECVAVEDLENILEGEKK